MRFAHALGLLVRDSSRDGRARSIWHPLELHACRLVSRSANIHASLLSHTNSFRRLTCSPSLVANLWDVTDRDIDRLSEAVLESMHLNGSETTDKVARNRRKRSTAEAVGDARSKCKLKYLTGAAPVVYGVPVGLLEESMS